MSGFSLKLNYIWLVTKQNSNRVYLEKIVSNYPTNKRAVSMFCCFLGGFFCNFCGCILSVCIGMYMNTYSVIVIFAYFSYPQNSTQDRQPKKISVIQYNFIIPEWFHFTISGFGGVEFCLISLGHHAMCACRNRKGFRCEHLHVVILFEITQNNVNFQGNMMCFDYFK